MIAIGVGMNNYASHKGPNRRCMNPDCRRPTVRGKRSCERPACRAFATDTFRRWEAHKTRTLRRLGGLCTRPGCKTVRMQGRSVCEAHQWRAEPCPTCGGRVPYRDSPGNQRRYYSDACQDQAQTKAAGVKLTDEVRQELQAMIAAAGITSPAKREG